MSLAHPQQVAVARKKTQEVVRKTTCEEPHRDLVVRICRIHPLEGSQVAFARYRVDMRPESPAVEPVDALRRHERAPRIREIGIRGGQKVGAHGDNIEERHDRPGRHGQAVFAKSPPHQLPLRGHVQAFARVRRFGLLDVAYGCVHGHRLFLQPNTGVDPHQQNVRNQGADDGHEAEQQDDGAGQEHVLGDQGFQQQRPHRGQA